jgi:ribosomal protein S12 methylthiotransferase
MVTVPRLQWIRLLYAYPNFLDQPLLNLIHENDKICKYIDIPFQHISPRLLRLMRRGKSGGAVRETVGKLRAAIPEVTLRTSLIVGFPGETEADFRELLNFVEDGEFERLGVFKYSREEGTAAAGMRDQVPEEEKEQRWQEVMDLQAEISRKKNRLLIGTIQRAIIDGYEKESERLFGRTQAHAPEVDGVVYVENGSSRKGDERARPGDFVGIKITQALDYDLIGEMQHGKID